MRIKLILAFPLDEAGVERRRAKIPAGVLADTTVVDCVPIIDAGKLLMDSYYNFALYEPFIIQQGVLAEEEGYDAVAVDTVSDVGVNALRSEGRSMLVITHYQRLLNYIVPDRTHVLAAGKIVRSGGPELALEVEEKGYKWIAEHAA